MSFLLAPRQSPVPVLGADDTGPPEVRGVSRQPHPGPVAHDSRPQVDHSLSAVYLAVRVTQLLYIRDTAVACELVHHRSAEQLAQPQSPWWHQGLDVQKRVDLRCGSLEQLLIQLADLPHSPRRRLCDCR